VLPPLGSFFTSWGRDAPDGAKTGEAKIDQPYAETESVLTNLDTVIEYSRIGEHKLAAYQGIVESELSWRTEGLVG